MSQSSIEVLESFHNATAIDETSKGVMAAISMQVLQDMGGTL